MNVLWIVVSVAVFAVFAKWMAWAYEHGGPSELGFVSHQWLAEYRLSQISDQQR